MSERMHCGNISLESKNTRYFVLKRICKDTLFQVILAVFLGYVLTPYLSQNMVEWALTMSNFVKAGLMYLLPVVTFTFIFCSMLKFARSAPLLILGVLILMQLSNLVAFTASFYAGHFVSPFLLTEGITSVQNTITITEKISISVPSIWTPMNGMLGGLIFGLIFSFVNSPAVFLLSELLKGLINKIFQKIFPPFLPIFIFGFFAKMRFEGTLTALMAGYSKVVLYIVVFSIVYLFIFTLFANFGHIRKTLRHYKNMIPAVLTGLSTMSTMAAMPLMFNMAKKEIDDEDFTNFIIPSIVNNHMLGDGFVFGTLAATIMFMYGAEAVPLSGYFIFMSYYALSKFSTAGVPAGTVAVTMPLLGPYLGFSSEMLSLFFTLGVLLDSVLTAGNVGGTCVLSKLAYRFLGGLLKK